jgi:hypothetical protein
MNWSYRCFPSPIVDREATDTMTRTYGSRSKKISRDCFPFEISWHTTQSRWFKNILVREILLELRFPGCGLRFMPLLKTEWVPLKIGPLLFIDRMVSNDAASYALVKAEARSDNCPPRSVGRLLPLPQPLAVGPNRPPRRAKFTHSKFKRARFILATRRGLGIDLLGLRYCASPIFTSIYRE